jgi:hypothetical protein
MSDTIYVPRAGSKAESAVAALSARKWLSADDLAAEVGCDRAQIDGNIAVAIREGLIRRVARDGKAGFALGATGDPPAREYEDGEAAPKRVKTRKAKPQKKAAPAKTAKRQAPAIKPAAGGPINGEHSVGILEDGTVVVIDWEGHAMSLSPVMARKIAELVARTS